MRKISSKPKLDFQDVLIKPRPTVPSEKVCLVSSYLHENKDKKNLNCIPIFTSGNNHVGTFRVATEMSKLKIFTTISKKYSPDDWAEFKNSLSKGSILENQKVVKENFFLNKIAKEMEKISPKIKLSKEKDKKKDKEKDKEKGNENKKEDEKEKKINVKADINNIAHQVLNYVAISTEMETGEIERLCATFEKVPEISVIVIEATNAFSDEFSNYVSLVSKTFSDKWIVAGNVLTVEGARMLINAGADIVKVGKGSDLHHKTRTQCSPVTNYSNTNQNLTSNKTMTETFATHKTVGSGKETETKAETETETETVGAATGVGTKTGVETTRRGFVSATGTTLTTDKGDMFGITSEIKTQSSFFDISNIVFNITDKETGVGYPQLSAIMECKDAIVKINKGYIMSDCGFEGSADTVKAWAAGADFVMLGTHMLCGHDECNGTHVTNGDKSYMKYEENHASETLITTYKGKIAGTMKHILKCIETACSYVGSKDIAGLYTNAEFVKIVHR